MKTYLQTVFKILFLLVSCFFQFSCSSGFNSYSIGSGITGTAKLQTIAGSMGGPGYYDGIGIGARFYRPSGVASDGTNLYVADNDNQVIRKVVIATGVVTTLAGTVGVAGVTDGTGTAAKFRYPCSLVVVGGNLYVTESNDIRKIVIATGVVTTFAGVSGTSGSTDATGTAARFNSPNGIATDGTNLYIADKANHTIRQVVISSGVVTTLAGTALATGSTDATGAAASFNSPADVATDGTNVYVTDSANATIRQVVISSGVVTTLAGTAGVTGAADGTGAAAQFMKPYGMTTDGTNLFVSDQNEDTIRQVVISSAVVTTLAGASSSGYVDGTGTAAVFSRPQGMVTVGGNLYLADVDNAAIRKIVISSGVTTTVAGAGPVGGSADGTGLAARFGGDIEGVATDGTNVYVADTSNDTIRKIVIATGVVTTLAGTAGTSGSTDATGAAASFNSPTRITTDGTNVFVADSQNYTLRKIVIATGVVTTLAGTAGNYGSADGTGAAASFAYLGGLATDGTYVYMADEANSLIRKVRISDGDVTTIAGSVGTSTSVDGTGAAASFADPSDVVTDGTNLYVADQNTVRKVVIATGVTTTIAGTDGVATSLDGTGAAASFAGLIGIATDGAYLYVADSSDYLLRKIDIASGVVTTLIGRTTWGTVDGTLADGGIYLPEAVVYSPTSGKLFLAQPYCIREIN